MKRPLAAIVVLVGVTSSAGAQNSAPVDNVGPLKEDTGPQQQGLITCWYNANGAYTGSDSAAPNAQAGGPYQTGAGDYTWSFNIAAPNGQSCPRTKPGG